MPSGSTSEPRVRQVQVTWERLPGWVERYCERHPGTSVSVTTKGVAAVSEDGSSFAFDIPFAPLAEPTLAALAAHLARPWGMGVVLVRKGGFAVARLVGSEVLATKVGQRHVQSRSKAGGWSQQRFARRRDNQARSAYDAASGHVQEILAPHARELDQLVTGGDSAAIDAVLDARALLPLREVARRWLPGLPDPKRAVLDSAIITARSTQVAILDTTRP